MSRRRPATRPGSQHRSPAGRAAVPGRPSARESAALATLFEQRHYSAAAALAQRLTESCPEHAPAWKALGDAFHALGMFEDALAPLRKASSLSPGSFEAQATLGVAQQYHGSEEEAEE